MKRPVIKVLQSLSAHKLICDGSRHYVYPTDRGRRLCDGKCCCPDMTTNENKNKN